MAKPKSDASRASTPAKAPPPAPAQKVTKIAAAPQKFIVRINPACGKLTHGILGGGVYHADQIYRVSAGKAAELRVMHSDAKNAGSPSIFLVHTPAEAKAYERALIEQSRERVSTTDDPIEIEDRVA